MIVTLKPTDHVALILHWQSRFLKIINTLLINHQDHWEKHSVSMTVFVCVSTFVILVQLARDSRKSTLIKMGKIIVLPI